MNSALLKHDLGLGAHSISTHTATTGRVFPLLRQAAELGRAWMERARQRNDLKRLDDRMLADIGISRSQAYEEASKPFWMA